MDDVCLSLPSWSVFVEALAHRVLGFAGAILDDRRWLRSWVPRRTAT